MNKECKYKAIFNDRTIGLKQEYICNNNINEDIDSDFCILHSKNKNKDLTQFNKALSNKNSSHYIGIIFPEQFNFLDIIRGNPLYIEHSEFYCDANCSEITREHDVFITNTKFYGKVNFENCRFRVVLYLENVYFKKNAKFNKLFTKVKFDNVVCEGNLDFSGTEFQNNVRFDMTVKGNAIFREAYFEGEVNFNSIDGNVGLFFNEVDFRKCKVTYPDKVFFSDVNLSKCLLSDTKIDLRRVDFKNVKWAVQKGINSIFDDVVKEGEEEESEIIKKENESNKENGKKLYELSLEKINRTYCDLKTNYSQRGNHYYATDFHYGELKTRRKALPFKWGNVALKLILRCYNCLSGYGTKPVRSSGWLLFVFLAHIFIIGSIELHHPQSILSTERIYFLAYIKIGIHYLAPILKLNSDTRLSITLINMLFIIFYFVLIPLIIISVRSRIKK